MNITLLQMGLDEHYNTYSSLGSLYVKGTININQIK